MRRELLALGSLMVILACAPWASAQDASFEVVSVKASAPSGNMSQTGWEPNRLFAYGVNLKQLIEWAYGVTDIQLSGGPGWMDSKSFDVEAKAEGAYTKDELLRMLKPVLADRFKVALHRETRQLPAYVLTAAGSRPEMHETKGGPTNIQLQAVPAPAGSKGLTLQITGQSVSMQWLSGYLTNTLSRLVVDRSGVQGSFDFKVEVALDEADLTDKRAAMSTALQDAMPKLGLKLDSQRQSVEILVIDHAEEPSPN
jgi:uncharacterized protein (TIGR03435 family)